MSSGFYEVTVYDNNGCIAADSIRLDAPDDLLLDLVVFSDTCSRGVGAVDLTASGGVIGYEYLWDSGQTTADVFDLFSGDNNVLVIDSNSCQAIGSVFIEDLEKPLPDFKTFPFHRRFYDQLVVLFYLENYFDIQVAMSTLDSTANPALIMALLMIFAGFGYKISAVPFHFWTPDVYEGSPTTITAYLSVAPKAAGFAMIIRFCLLYTSPSPRDS